MTTTTEMTAGTPEQGMSDARKRQARRVGLLYFFAVITGPFALLYVPAATTVVGNASATADRIRASSVLLRIGIADEIFICTMLALAALALYRLLKDVDQSVAAAMVVLVLISVPIELLNVVNVAAAMILANGGSVLAGLGHDQADALAYLFMRLHGKGLEVAQVFWGLWLVPYGILVIRSRFIPAPLGAALLAAATGYVLVSTGALVIPQYAHALGQLGGVLEAGEVPVALYLLFWGARPISSQRMASRLGAIG